MQSGGLEVLQYITSFFPATIPTLMHFLIHYVGVFSSGDRVGSWHEILKIPHYIPRHLEAEYAVPVENAPAAVKDILEFVKKIQVGSSQFNEVSTIGYLSAYIACVCFIMVIKLHACQTNI